MTILWDQLALTEHVSYVIHRESQRLIQFLMALHSNFESLHGFCIVILYLLLMILLMNY